MINGKEGRLLDIRSGEVYVDSRFIATDEVELTSYRVMLHEDAGDKLQIAFDCQAEDADHAAEQAGKAYPGCEVISTTPFTEQNAKPRG